MKRMKSAFFCVILMTAASSLPGFDWPVDDPELISSFGSSEGHHFSIGVRIAGKDGEVNPAEDGEVIFYWDEKQKRSSLPSGLGNMAVVEHANGLKTIYGHLKDTSYVGDDLSDYDVDHRERLGEIGNTGWTFGNQLFFSIFDSEFNQYVNPILVLPSTVDLERPVIRRTALVFGDSLIFLEEDILVTAGQYDIIAEVYDTGGGAQVWSRQAPFSVLVYINGSEISRIVFEALQEIESKVVLQTSGLAGHNELYYDERSMILGSHTFIPGLTSLEIIVKDYQGNEAAELYRFEVVE
jgi:hypothetical protein